MPITLISLVKILLTSIVLQPLKSMLRRKVSIVKEPVLFILGER